MAIEQIAGKRPLGAIQRAAKRSGRTCGPDQWVGQDKRLPDLRWNKVQKIRQALNSGQYDLDDRLEKLFSRLPEALGDLYTD